MRPLEGCRERDESRCSEGFFEKHGGQLEADVRLTTDAAPLMFTIISLHRHEVGLQKAREPLGLQQAGNGGMGQ